jgi:hypothetical protein
MLYHIQPVQNQWHEPWLDLREDEQDFSQLGLVRLRFLSPTLNFEP